MSLKLLLRNLIWAAPAALAYTVVLPLAARAFDRRLGLSLDLPVWAGSLLLAAGASVAVWSVWALAAIGEGTPNPLQPPRKLVLRGPYRCSRNPMMLGGWIAGAGLAFALGSPAMLAAVVLIIAAGSVYVRVHEEPRLLDRFGNAYSDYMRSVPRWICLRHALSHHTQNG